MEIIKGKWRWNDEVECDSTAHDEYNVNFSSNGKSFDRLVLEWSTGYHYLKYVGEETVVVGQSANEGDDTYPIDKAYRDMNFGDDGQEIDQVLYEFITANAFELTVAKKLEMIAEYQKEMFDAGKRAEYDAFWDAFQENGARTDYQNAFCGVGWTNEVFKPKYPFGTITNVYQMFRGSHINDDLTKFNIDVSNVVNADYLFYSSWFTKIGVFGVQSNRGMNTTFGSCTYLETIEKIKSVAATVFDSTFDRCLALRNITFEGEIANDISFKDSTLLTKDSITNIINHLSDTASGKTLQLSKTAIDTAFGAYSADCDGDGKHDAWIGNDIEEWIELIDSKPNWDIVAV